MAMESSDCPRGKQIMEALSEFLQSTKRAVEHLCEGHTLSSVQASKQKRPDGPSAFGMLPVAGKGFCHPLANDGAGKADQARSWSVPYTCLDERFSQSKVVPSGKAAPVRCHTLSEPEMEHAVGFFLKDVKTTVDTWCSRYCLLADGKVSFDAGPQPLHTNMQVMDQLDFDADQDFSVMEELDPSHVRDNEVSHICAQNGKAVGISFAKQVVAGSKRPFTTSRTNRNRARASVSSLQGTVGSMETAQNIDLSQRDMVAAQEPTPSESELENRKMNMNHTYAMEGQDIVNSEDMDAEKTSTNDGEFGESIVGGGVIVKLGSPEKKPMDDVESPIETDELTIRRYQCKVEVVESPDWLPKGWVTELKTRGTGGSAGCKDKYYFDPVSKRRCRSQKEVFCFLETGKLGRYKRRLKLQPSNKLLGIDLEQQVNNSSEMQAANKRGVSGTRTSVLSEPYAQDSTPGPLAVFPGTGQRGVVGSTFLPYRPGQTSDFLYESMANLSRPVMDQYHFMDPSSSKSNGDRSSASRPWFLTNAEGATRPLFDRFETDKMDKGNGQSSVRGRRGTEGAPKRARKSSKRSAS